MWWPNTNPPCLEARIVWIRRQHAQNALSHCPVLCWIRLSVNWPYSIRWLTWKIKTHVATFLVVHFLLPVFTHWTTWMRLIGQVQSVIANYRSRFCPRVKSLSRPPLYYPVLMSSFCPPLKLRPRLQTQKFHQMLNGYKNTGFCC